jgi:hypothetical protein
VRYQLPLCFGKFLFEVIFSCIVSVRFVLLQSRLTSGDRKARALCREEKKSSAANTLPGSGVRICRSISEHPFRLPTVAQNSPRF